MKNEPNEALEKLIADVDWETVRRDDCDEFSQSFVLQELATLNKIKTESIYYTRVMTLVTVMALVLLFLAFHINLSTILVCTLVIQAFFIVIAKLFDMGADMLLEQTIVTSQAAVKNLVRKYPLDVPKEKG